MKPVETTHENAAAPAAPIASPGMGTAQLREHPRARGAGGSDPLRGLADNAPDGAHASGSSSPSLWTRIKRAFQYGSQVGDSR